MSRLGRERGGWDWGLVLAMAGWGLAAGFTAILLARLAA